MAFNTFSLLVVVRTSLIMLGLLVLVGLFNQDGYQMATLLSALVVVALCIDLLRFVRKTNNELVRFLDAARFADYSQKFDLSEQGAGFEELGKTFSQILNNLHAKRGDLEVKIRYLTSLVEHVPVPLISVAAQGEITLWNFSARKLFGQHHVHNLADLKTIAPELYEAIVQIEPGERRLVRLAIDGMEHKLSLSISHLVGQGMQDALISLQDIQSELDFAQMEAWQDLVKVLTHEIMNSITPVSSLAKTSVELVDDLRSKAFDDSKEEIDELHHAIDTVARRSDSLIKFVSSYRKLTDMPDIHWGKVNVDSLFNLAVTIARQANQQCCASIKTQVNPANLEINADKDLLEQVLINLLKNAIQATEHKGQNGQILLSASINRRGHGVIEVSDNGDGIDSEIIDQIFVPFFTTKRDGSGVGLALTRQVMIAHKGNVKAENAESGGATITLIF